MNPKTKILIGVLIGVILIGGIFAWQYWKVQKELTECSKSKDSDNCYYDLATNYRNPVTCEEIQNPAIRDSCYSEIAIKKDDLSICNKVADFHEKEYYCKAIISKDLEKCEKISYEYPGKTQDMKDSCYYEIAKKTNDLLACTKMFSKWWKGVCYNEIAKDCKKIPEVDYQFWCEAEKSKSTEICHRVKDSDIRISCFIFVSPFPEGATEQVTITTDKTEYEQGERVKITIRNNLDRKISFGYDGGIEYLKNGEWITKGYFWSCPCGISSCRCDIRCDTEFSYIEKLESNNEKSLEWDQKIPSCEPDMIKKEAQAPFGQYRVRIPVFYGYNYYNSTQIYSNEFRIKEIKERQVTIATDKTEYEQGEEVKVTVFNGLDFSIYADFWKGSWIVLQYQDGQWKEIFYGSQKTLPTCICGKYPGGECPEWEAPQEKFDEIKPSEKVIWVWDQKILKGTDNGCSIWVNASPGKYKVKFRHFYTLDPNEREWEKVYSNEFTIK
jgi:hypothetical protein